MNRHLLAGLCCLMASAVGATQYTHDRILGFSEDGLYFAFKTYGLQRGSGLPYVNVYVVDLVRDAWVSGTPIRASLGEDAMAEVEAAPFAALEDQRAEVMQAAAPILHELRIRRPATVLFAAGIGQAHLDRDVTEIVFPNPDDPTRDPWGQMTLALTSISRPSTLEYCEDPRGFRLEQLSTDAAPIVLHEDQRVPASRGCAQAYRLDAVVAAGYPNTETPLVALISVWRQGFEGLARDVIALPVPVAQSHFVRPMAAP